MFSIALTHLIILLFYVKAATLCDKIYDEQLKLAQEIKSSHFET